MVTRVLLFIGVAMVMVASALHLPAYIKPCARNKAFKECAMKHAEEARSDIFKGDRKYHIPSLDPLLVDAMTVGTNPGPIDILIRLRDMKIWNMPSAILRDFDVNFETRSIDYEVFFPRLQVEGQYNMSGKILILPVNGQGGANITLLEVSIHVDIDYNLTRRSNGKQYMRPGVPVIKIDIKRAYMHFDNLFNGNKALEDQMNSIIDTNWKDLIDEMGPSIGENIGLVLMSLSQYVFERVPYEEVFPLE